MTENIPQSNKVPFVVQAQASLVALSNKITGGTNFLELGTPSKLFDTDKHETRQGRSHHQQRSSKATYPLAPDIMRDQGCKLMSDTKNAPFFSAEP